MQAIMNTENLKDKLDYLLNDVNATTKNEVENKIVSLGSRVVNILVEKLKTIRGIQRSVVAMSLIRIGESSIPPLKQFAMENVECRWMADYLISEI